MNSNNFIFFILFSSRSNFYSTFGCAAFSTLPLSRSGACGGRSGYPRPCRKFRRVFISCVSACSRFSYGRYCSRALDLNWFFSLCPGADVCFSPFRTGLFVYVFQLIQDLALVVFPTLLSFAAGFMGF
jgi:hypothetical protein